MNDEQALDFNFWPSFADMMLAIVFVLVLVIALFATALTFTIDTETIRERQEAVLMQILQDSDGTLNTMDASTVRISQQDSELMTIKTDIQLQRISFSDNVLFETDRFDLTKRGQRVLGIVGNAVKGQIDNLSQIDIEGHTDTWLTRNYSKGNLELGAFRAMAVFEFLNDSVGIDPRHSLMSAISYGEYKPVGRVEDSTFGADRLNAANDTQAERASNRRVELVLRYRHL